MNAKESINIMTDLEKEFNLFDLEIRNLKVWYFCRHEINYIIRSAMSTNKVKNKTKFYIDDKIKTNLIKAILYIKSLKWRFNTYKHTEILCLSTINMRRDEEEGKSFDIMFDYIGKYSKNIKYSILNTFNGKQFDKNCYTEECYNMTNYCLNIYLYKKYYKLILRKNEIEKIKILFDKIERYIMMEYKIHISITNIILRNIAALIMSFKYAYKTLKKVNPRVLYVECAYSNVHLPFIYAAKKIGIKIVEFQHGIVTKKHLGYMFNYKDMLKDPIPDYICVYGKYFGDLLKEINPKLNSQIIEYGYPYLYEQIINNITNNENKYKYIITTQGEYNRNNWIDFLMELVQIDKQSKILVKLHPSEVNYYKQYYSELIGNDRIEFDSDRNLYECLQMSEIHLSCFSTCHYEALCLNKKTVVIMFPGWENVKVLKEYGVDFILNPKELLNLSYNKDSILFDKFKKDFFNIDDKLTHEYIEKKINNINEYFIQ